MRFAPVLLMTLALPMTAAAQLHPAVRTAADSLLALTRDQTRPTVWPDRRDSTRFADRRRLDAVDVMLRRIDRASLRDAEDQLLYDNLSEVVAGQIGTRVCRDHLWRTTSTFAGWHVVASNAARVQPVGSDSARARALAVFAELPAAIRAERRMLQRGLDSGYTTSRSVVEAVVRQIDELLPADVTRSPLDAPARRDSSDAFRAAWRALLADSVYPAAAAFRDFLTRSYLPAARAEGSLAALPQGQSCYQATLRLATSLRIDADSVMRDARRDLERLTRLAAPLVLRLTGDSNTSRGIITLRTSPQFAFPSRDSVLAAYRAMTLVAARSFDRVVAGLRPESLVVSPYPEFQERANLPPQYLRASDDGTRPAHFLVNLARMERMAVANAVAHEGYPGHHLQRIAAARAPTIHPVMRSIGVGAFSEGWGIYSEDLAGPMGLYVTPLDSVGALVHLLDVAAGNYLDIGYHAKGWTRQQLVDSMVILGGRPRAQAEAYADRHAALPAQLAQYFVGYRAISDARRFAQERLGSSFRMPDFHYEVLRDGSVTLASMRAKIERWVEAGGQRRATAADTLLWTTGTFSILGYDAATGEIGGAVQSRVFAVGNGVLWAEATLGVVTTQAIVDVSYGPQALAYLRQGLTAEEVVKRVLADDPDPRPQDWSKQGRQFAVLDAKGNIFAHTGPRATEWAGHKACAQPHVCTAQGNILAGPGVVDSMVAAFERTPGKLQMRLFAALEAGQAAGGDKRGQQSAAILIVNVKKSCGIWLNNDVVLRLQVDDSPEPIKELRRLVEHPAAQRRSRSC